MVFKRCFCWESLKCPISKGIRNAKRKRPLPRPRRATGEHGTRTRRYTRKNNLHLSGLNLGAHTRATSSLSLSPVAAPRRTPFVPAVGGRRRHRSKHAGPWSPLPSPLHRHCEPCANQAGPVLHFAQPTIARLWEFTVLMLARPAAAAGGRTPSFKAEPIASAALVLQSKLAHS